MHSILTIVDIWVPCLFLQRNKNTVFFLTDCNSPGSSFYKSNILLERLWILFGQHIVLHPKKTQYKLHISSTSTKSTYLIIVYHHWSHKPLLNPKESTCRVYICTDEVKPTSTCKMVNVVPIGGSQNYFQSSWNNNLTTWRSTKRKIPQYSG